MPRLAIYSLGLALLIALIAKLPRLVIACLFAAVVGAIAGIVEFVSGGFTRDCVYSGTAPLVDTCSGTYYEVFGPHRAPTWFGIDPNTWILVLGGVAGALTAVLLTLAIWATWKWVRRNRSTHQLGISGSQ
jgi:hypothetical protein